MGRAFRGQANALLRKNLVYQRRNLWSNCNLLCTPIAFCVLLAVIQMLVNNLVLSGEDFKCGCQCFQCCLPDKHSPNGRTNCTDLSEGPACEAPKKCFDDPGLTKKCGAQFSTVNQAAWCPIEHPSAWAPLLQVPKVEDRASPWRPAATLLYTGRSAQLADAMTQIAFGEPSLGPQEVEETASYLQGLSSAFNSTGSIIPGELLALLGLKVGTSSKGWLSLYMEEGLFDGEQYILLPEGNCQALGLNGSSKSLSDFTSAILRRSNDPTTAESLMQVVGAIVGGSAGQEPDGPSSNRSQGEDRLSTLRFNCTEAHIEYQVTALPLKDALFCGYKEAKCDGRALPNQYLGAYDWRDTDRNIFSPDVYFNDTFSLGGDQPNLQRIGQLFSQAVHSWLRTFVDPQLTSALIGVAGTPKAASKLTLDFSSLIGPLFYSWVVQMMFPTILSQLVYEKEKRLRIMMKMHGLGDGAYWVVMYCWYLLLYIVYIFIFLAAGSAIGLNFFIRNSYAIQVIFYFLFGNTLIAFSFLLSSLFTSSKTASVFAFLVVFGSGLVGELLLDRLFTKDIWYNILLELIPPLALYRSLWELGQYAFLGTYRDTPAMTMARLGDKSNGMVTVWLILVVEWALFMIVGWYLEQVVSTGTGLHKHPLYFLRLGRSKTQPADEVEMTQQDVQASGGEVVVNTGAEAEDVAGEVKKVESLKGDFQDHPIVVKGLKKIFEGQGGEGNKVAVRDLSLAVETGECFGLLGPNGAGKSTSINMMVGFLEPTAGTVYVEGKDIRTEMGRVYERMGVCPQDDLQWETLTGAEHLRFYGRLKGLGGDALEQAVESSLRGVNLWNGGVGNKQSNQYSGGMRRRLSVAVSFIGRPGVVYLDEPSTGLDPASRRQLWNVVKQNKQERAVILTTHSMEEAEVLCDRLGIFVDGALVCIGNPREIAARYGTYYVLTVTAPPGKEEEVQALVSELSPSNRLTYSLGGTLRYELSCEEVSLPQVFSAMQEHKGRLEVSDWGVANATLEEVFIKIARSRQSGSDEGT